ncbi:hypothetical protein [Vibrio cholerae]|uniref:hypothetical protein n=3 Tax=Vibrio cholerae TaxID=666 RepID=UPI001F1A374F|nr:hypothetical protein [Vibrio cholerae]MCR9968663.1 hypothetical protein [Vibrio cholerae]MDY7588738.1 hypothetical protein [Vibrio cholerae]GHX58108.1 hypothetical protein VCSRO109_3569 [Vibrio cholerae]GHZ12166.1 hypothetical protein VCSRO122_3551 [Vibrio cholerae]
MSNFEDSNRHMERKRQIEWLKIQKKGFFRHFLGCGLGFSIPVILGGAFVQNDFYLDLSPIVSYRVYLMTLFGAAFFAGCDWYFKSREYKKYKEKLLRKNYS